MEEIKIKNQEEMEKYFHKDKGCYIFKEGKKLLDVDFCCDIYVDGSILAGNIVGNNITADNIHVKDTIECDYLNAEIIIANNIYAHETKYFKLKISNELSSTFIIGGDIKAKNIISDMVYAGSIEAEEIKATNIISTENIYAENIKAEGFVCAYDNIIAEISEGGNLFFPREDKKLIICCADKAYDVNGFRVDSFNQSIDKIDKFFSQELSKI